MKKKVMLIYPSAEDKKGTNEETTNYPSWGIVYLASHQKEKTTLNSYDIKSIDANGMQILNKNIIGMIIKEGANDNLFVLY